MKRNKMIEKCHKCGCDVSFSSPGFHDRLFADRQRGGDYICKSCQEGNRSIPPLTITFETMYDSEAQPAGVSAVITTGAFSRVYPTCKTEDDALLTAITTFINERGKDNGTDQDD
jgi:hypothetical protein